MEITENNGQFYIPLRDSKELVRDYHSRGVASMDKYAGRIAQQRIAFAKDQLRRQNATEARHEESINKLQGEMSEIKDMLKTLLERKS